MWVTKLDLVISWLLCQLLRCINVSADYHESHKDTFNIFIDQHMSHKDIFDILVHNHKCHKGTFNIRSDCHTSQ